MIPIVHQSRAGPPTATTGVRAVEAVSTPLVLSDGNGPAVEQGGAASPDVQLGQHGDLAQTPQRQPSVPRRAPPADLDVPHDKLVFRGKVLRFLSAV